MENLAQKHVKQLVEKGVVPDPNSPLEVYKGRQVKIKLILDHKREQDYIEKRLDVKETTSHALGLVTYAIIGFIDQAIESFFYLGGEITNDVTFGVSRIIFRAKDGWNKGREAR